MFLIIGARGKNCPESKQGDRLLDETPAASETARTNRTPPELALRRPGAGLDLGANRSYDSLRYLTKQEAAEVVGLHPKTIEREISRGRLRAFKPAGKIRIRPADLDAWIESTAVEYVSVHAI